MKLMGVVDVYVHHENLSLQDSVLNSRKKKVLMNVTMVTMSEPGVSKKKRKK